MGRPGSRVGVKKRPDVSGTVVKRVCVPRRYTPTATPVERESAASRRKPTAAHNMRVSAAAARQQVRKQAARTAGALVLDAQLPDARRGAAREGGEVASGGGARHAGSRQVRAAGNGVAAARGSQRGGRAVHEGEVLRKARVRNVCCASSGAGRERARACPSNGANEYGPVGGCALLVAPSDRPKQLPLSRCAVAPSGRTSTSDRLAAALWRRPKMVRLTLHGAEAVRSRQHPQAHADARAALQCSPNHGEVIINVEAQRVAALAARPKSVLQAQELPWPHTKHSRSLAPGVGRQEEGYVQVHRNSGAAVVEVEHAHRGVR